MTDALKLVDPYNEISPPPHTGLVNPAGREPGIYFALPENVKGQTVFLPFRRKWSLSPIIPPLSLLTQDISLPSSSVGGTPVRYFNDIKGVGTHLAALVDWPPAPLVVGKTPLPKAVVADVYVPEFVNAWVALGAPGSVTTNPHREPEGAREIIMKYAKEKYPTRSRELLRTAPLTGIAPLRSHCAKVLVELWRIATTPENPVTGADALDLVRHDSEESYAEYFSTHRAPVDLVVERVDPSAPRETAPLTTALLRALLARKMVVGVEAVGARVKSYIAYFNLSRELVSSRFSYAEKELRRALMEVHQLNMTLDKQKYAAAILSHARHQKPPPGAIAPPMSSEDILGMFSWGGEGGPPGPPLTTDKELKTLVDEFYADDMTNMHKLFPLALPSTPEEARAIKAARAYKAAGKDPWAGEDTSARPPAARGWIWRPALDSTRGEYIVAFERAADMTFPPTAERSEGPRGLEGALVPFVGYPGNWQYGPSIEIPSRERRCLRTGVLYTETGNHSRAASWRRERIINLPSGDHICRVIHTRGWFSADSEAPYADGDETTLRDGADQGKILHPRTEDQLIEDAAELWYGPLGSYGGFLPYDPARVTVIAPVDSDTYDNDTPTGRARWTVFSEMRERIYDYRDAVRAWHVARSTPVQYSVRGAPPAPPLKGDVIKKTRPAGGLLLYYDRNFDAALDIKDSPAEKLAEETRRLILEYEDKEGGVLVDEAAFLQTLTLGDARFYSRTHYAAWFGDEELERFMDILDVVLGSARRAERAPLGEPSAPVVVSTPENVATSVILEFIKKARPATGAGYRSSSTLTEALRIARAVLVYPNTVKTREEREGFILAADAERKRPHVFKPPRGSNIVQLTEIAKRQETGLGAPRLGLLTEFGVLVLPIIADAIWYILKDVTADGGTDQRIKEAWAAVAAASKVVDSIPSTPVRDYARALVEFMRELVYYTLDVRLHHTQREIFRDLGEL